MLPNQSRSLNQVSEGESARILVVDDEPTVRRLTARVLMGEGYQVSEAQDGLEALHIVLTNGAELDMVISDIVMPKLNGVELLQSIVSAHPGLPVILMSGYGAARLTEMGIAAPCGVLLKPFPPEALVAEVRRCMRTRN
jgi:two-component system, cell cycle sensor histidine kinase and response regulator CckA